MWPQYRIKDLDYKKLYFLQNRSFVDCYGVVSTVNSYEELKKFMYDNNAMAIAVDNVVNFEWLDEAVHDLSGADVICDRKGTANMIRFRYKNKQTRWIVSSYMWIDRDKLDDLGSQFLVELDNFFHYIGTGTCITPGSAGHKGQILAHQRMHYKKLTCVSLSVEKFLRDHCISGPIITTKTGEFVESMMNMDAAGNFLAYWVMLPEGAAVWVNGDQADVERYATFFCECTVDVTYTLPMGVFPVRAKNGRIKYPTETGRYYAVYLWKEQVKYCRDQGCKVYVHGGCAWKELVSYSWEWANDIYWKRRKAESEIVAYLCKRSGVSGIGHHGMQRQFFRLVPDDGTYQGSIITTFTDEGEPLCYVAMESEAVNEAYLLHKQRYCASMASLGSLQFAWEFAVDGRLVQVYHDSCLVIERNEEVEYISKRSNEALEAPPGTWMWERLTGVTVYKNGDINSNEYKRMRPKKQVHAR